MINIDYSREGLERTLPVARQKNDSLYNSLSPDFSGIQHRIEQDILGDEVVNYLKTNTENTADDLARGVKVLEMTERLVYIRAFLSRFRSLDVVLTGTGFGVVSTQDLAPASRERVDRVEEETRTLERRTVESLIYYTSQLPDVEWNNTPQRARNFPTLFSRIEFLKRHAGMEPTAKNWTAAQADIAKADTLVREVLGDKQIDSMLNDFTTEGFCPSFQFQLANDLILDYMGAIVADSQYLEIYRRRMLRYFYENADQFPAYHSSSAYTANHTPDHENRRSSPAFFFNG